MINKQVCAIREHTIVVAVIAGSSEKQWLADPGKTRQMMECRARTVIGISAGVLLNILTGVSEFKWAKLRGFPPFTRVSQKPTRDFATHGKEKVRFFLAS